MLAVLLLGNLLRNQLCLLRDIGIPVIDSRDDEAFIGECLGDRPVGYLAGVAVDMLQYLQLAADHCAVFVIAFFRMSMDLYFLFSADRLRALFCVFRIALLAVDMHLRQRANPLSFYIIAIIRMGMGRIVGFPANQVARFIVAALLMLVNLLIAVERRHSQAVLIIAANQVPLFIVTALVMLMFRCRIAADQVAFFIVAVGVMRMGGRLITADQVPLFVIAVLGMGMGRCLIAANQVPLFIVAALLVHMAGGLVAADQAPLFVIAALLVHMAGGLVAAD